MKKVRSVSVLLVLVIAFGAVAYASSCVYMDEWKQLYDNIYTNCQVTYDYHNDMVIEQNELIDLNDMLVAEEEQMEALYDEMGKTVGIGFTDAISAFMSAYSAWLGTGDGSSIAEEAASALDAIAALSDLNDDVKQLKSDMEDTVNAIENKVEIIEVYKTGLYQHTNGSSCVKEID
ncbi:hypothetical protein [Maledivibacter halophilus]|nr:hypothetical protein [Maledivibacter halophilus]